MNRTTKALLAAGAATALLITGAACTDEADTVSHNISKDADNFKVNRRIVFFNGITDTYLLTIEGRCNITDEGNQLEVVCKTGDDEYLKHFLGLSDNVSYFAEQLDAIEADPYHHKITFAPERVIPEIDLQTSGDEGDN